MNTLRLPLQENQGVNSILPTIRVLQVLSNFGIGGAETWLISLLRYFKENAAELGCQVQTDVFLTHGIRDRLDDEAEALGARLIYARYSRKTLPSFISTWRRTLASERYDAIHDHQEFSSGWHFLFGVGRLPPIRISHLHNPMSHQVSYGTGPGRRASILIGNHLIARQATHLLSTSRQLITEQGFDDLSAARRLKKMSLYCGFDPSRFMLNSRETHTLLRSQFELPPESKVVLFVGRLDSNMDESCNQKNPSFCLEVARECARRDPSFICLLAGGGEVMRKRLQERVLSWGLAKRILLLGPRQDVPHLMAGADLLLFPSFAEGLGMVAVEAQSAGLPVIASDGVPEECCVVEGMVDFLPLAAGVDHWAGKVMQKLNQPKPDRIQANLKVAASPFSISNSAMLLTSIYRGEI
jgi:glycosyltransferase involved in cell wall biosynthesis